MTYCTVPTLVLATLADLTRRDYVCCEEVRDEDDESDDGGEEEVVVARGAEDRDGCDDEGTAARAQEYSPVL